MTNRRERGRSREESAACSAFGIRTRMQNDKPQRAQRGQAAENVAQSRRVRRGNVSPNTPQYTDSIHYSFAILFPSFSADSAALREICLSVFLRAGILHKVPKTHRYQVNDKKRANFVLCITNTNISSLRAKNC